MSASAVLLPALLLFQVFKLSLIRSRWWVGVTQLFRLHVLASWLNGVRGALNHLQLPLQRSLYLCQRGLFNGERRLCASSVDEMFFRDGDV